MTPGKISAKLCDLTGGTFGGLTVMRRSSVHRGHATMWECLCVCGRTVTADAAMVQRRLAQDASCRCPAAPAARQGTALHGPKQQDQERTALHEIAITQHMQGRALAGFHLPSPAVHRSVERMLRRGHV